MSLINDALKRAREAQNQASPGQAELPPLEPAARGGPTSPWALVLLLVAMLGFAGAFAWKWFAHDTSAASDPHPGHNPLAVEPAAAPVPAQPVATPQFAAKPAPVVPPPQTPPITSATADTPVASAAPKPPLAYKLQSIFYSPARPCAVINGKILYVGDHVGEGRVAAITKDSAVVVSVGGQSNVLVLAD